MLLVSQDGSVFRHFIILGYWYFAERNGTKFGVPSGELKNNI